jgi:hypothetical protein
VGRKAVPRAGPGEGQLVQLQGHQWRTNESSLQGLVGREDPEEADYIAVSEMGEDYMAFFCSKTLKMRGEFFSCRKRGFRGRGEVREEMCF